MKPPKPLPYSDEFASADDYIDALLHYVSTTPIFQTLCGGVHIMDFYTTDPGLFYSVVPADWQAFLLDQEPMELLDFLLRDDVDAVSDKPPQAEADAREGRVPPPASLVQYVRDVRRLSLRRSPERACRKKPAPLARKITMGMSVKKIHEVTHFADYVHGLADAVSAAQPAAPITHLLDVGSGQNYLGRALASEPYCRRVVAVESKEHNIAGARAFDLLTGVAGPGIQRPRRNKKLFQQMLDRQRAPEQLSDKARKRLARQPPDETAVTAAAELRPIRELTAALDAVDVTVDDRIQYVQGRLENGDLSAVLAQVPVTVSQQQPGVLAVSIHSCGNLSHYGLRALVLNPAVRAVAIIGCCYNLLTERLGPPTVKIPGLTPARPTLQPVNGRVRREAERRDPEGFPMSARMATYEAAEGGGEPGIRFNITARMMACQAPGNWTAAESEGFFTRHFYRAVLQRIFLDRGALERVRWAGEGSKQSEDGEGGEDKKNESERSEEKDLETAVPPIIVGSLRKACYASLATYVRGAVAKMAAQGNGDGSASAAANAATSAAVAAHMAGLTDEALAGYAACYGARKRELSAVWSLMAFSAGLVESAIAADRWLFLREQQAAGVVADCWVESVFAYGQSPRNLVVVGVKADR